MTFETKALMRSSWFIGLVVVLVGITAQHCTRDIDDTQCDARPERTDCVRERGRVWRARSRQLGRHRRRAVDIRPGRGTRVLPEWQLIAFSSLRRGDRDIYVLAPDGSTLHQITFTRADDRDPAWSPDGARLAFETTRNGGQTDIYSVAANGTGWVSSPGHPRTSSIRHGRRPGRRSRTRSRAAASGRSGS